jgi:hypothetical protein
VALAARGVDVAGIELSKAMAARLRAKTGGDAIPVEIGDMATTSVDGQFSLVYLVYNTIMNLTTQDAQVACFRNAALHLSPGGCFMIEVGVPGLRTLPPGTTHQVFHSSDDYWGIDEYDVLNQGLISHHVDNADGHYRYLDAIPLRVAGGVRPDGEARGDDASRPVGRLAPTAVHGGEHVARFGLAEARVDVSAPLPPGITASPIPRGDPACLRHRAKKKTKTNAWTAS